MGMNKRAVGVSVPHASAGACRYGQCKLSCLVSLLSLMKARSASTNRTLYSDDKYQETLSIIGVSWSKP
jgi:hypothetical protein